MSIFNFFPQCFVVLVYKLRTSFVKSILKFNLFDAIINGIKSFYFLDNQIPFNVTNLNSIAQKRSQKVRRPRVRKERVQCHTEQEWEDVVSLGLGFLICESGGTALLLWWFYDGGPFKICAQILRYAFLEKVEPSFLPFECGCNLSVDSLLRTGHGRCDRISHKRHGCFHMLSLGEARCHSKQPWGKSAGQGTEASCQKLCDSHVRSTASSPNKTSGNCSSHWCFDCNLRGHWAKTIQQCRFWFPDFQTCWFPQHPWICAEGLMHTCTPTCWPREVIPVLWGKSSIFQNILNYVLNYFYFLNFYFKIFIASVHNWFFVY